MKAIRLLWSLITLAAIAAMALTGCVPAAAPAPAVPTAAPAPAEAVPSTNALGVPLPADAAPWEQQVDVSYGEFGSWEHWAEGIYALGGGSAINYYTQEPLLWLDPFNKAVPLGAESWEANEDATVWTFHIREGLQWSDGQPLTAHDWAFTFQYQADPANAFDFNWFYAAIKGLDAAVKGDIKPTEIGVSAKDDLTLVFEMANPTPWWPGVMASAFPLPKQAIEKCGQRVWSVKPECFVASGPYTLTKYERDRIAVVSLNPNYRGVARPILAHYAHIYAPQATIDWMALYRKDEAATASLATLPANVQEEVRNDPVYKDQLFVNMSGCTTYISMDTTRPPFDDLRVRKAFAMVIDRETISRDIQKGTTQPNYSIVPPVSPGYNGDAYKSIWEYNPEKAKELMAEAGYPDGKGFPELTYYVRNDNPVVPEAMVSVWQKTLGVNLRIESFDRANFMQKMFARNFQIYQLAYCQDYPDPANLLNLWLCATQRHEWCDPAYDAILEKSASETDPEKRLALLWEAETYLYDNVGVVPLNTLINYSLVKPWYTSKSYEAMRQGAPSPGSYANVYVAESYYTKDAPASWPPVDPNDLK